MPEKEKTSSEDYPQWAVDKAKEIIEKEGGKLESTVKSVFMFYEAKKKATTVDPNEPGRAVTGYISIVPHSH